MLVIIIQVILGEESIIHDIIPITDKIRFQSESRKESASQFITSFSIDIDDLIIGKIRFPFRKGMKISEIEFKEICISLSLDHDNFVDEKYFGQILKFQEMDKT